MIAIIFAIAAASSAPQYTTPQGNGQHSNDQQREDGRKDRHRPAEDGSRRMQDEAEKDRAKPGTPAENRDADGVLMPGAPGTENPTIPNGPSSGG